MYLYISLCQMYVLWIFMYIHTYILRVIHTYILRVINVVFMSRANFSTFVNISVHTFILNLNAFINAHSQNDSQNAFVKMHIHKRLIHV